MSKLPVFYPRLVDAVSTLVGRIPLLLTILLQKKLSAIEDGMDARVALIIDALAILLLFWRLRLTHRSANFLSQSGSVSKRAVSHTVWPCQPP